METFAQLVGRKKNTSPGLRAEEGIDETILTHTLTNSVCQEKITNSILGLLLPKIAASAPLWNEVRKTHGIVRVVDSSGTEDS